MKGTENGKEIGSKRDHTLNIKKKILHCVGNGELLTNFEREWI